MVKNQVNRLEIMSTMIASTSVKVYIFAVSNNNNDNNNNKNIIDTTITSLAGTKQPGHTGVQQICLLLLISKLALMANQPWRALVMIALVTASAIYLQ